MKIKSIILYAAAAFFAAGCSMEKGFEQESQSDSEVSFIAHTETAPESKVTLGTSSNSKPQTFWDNSDIISVYTDGGEVPSGYKRTAFAFSTALEKPTPTARFSYAESDFVEGNNYLAVYPHRSTARVVKLDDEANDGEVYRFANFTVPTDQTLVAGSFDKKAMLMVAYADELRDLQFKNAVALIKFRVADDNVTSGQIYSAGSALSGTFIGRAGEDMEPKLDTYGSGDKNSYVNFALADETPLTPGVDYYVAVRPDKETNGNYLDQDNGFGIKLNGVTVKEYPSVKNFKRNTIYDLGTLSVPAVATLTVSFDFTDAEAMSEWPTSGTPEGVEASDLLKAPYTVDGVTYEFTCANPLEATGPNFPYFDAEKSYLYIKSYRYVGLPAIEGYKLSKVVLVNGGGENSSRLVGITTKLAKQVEKGDEGQEFATGGEPIAMSGGTDTEVEFNLSETSENTIYWVRFSPKTGALKGMTLTYLPASAKSGIIVRIGTYNLKVVKSSDAGEYAWEKRKPRLKQSICDNDFDVFGVNECNDKLKTFINSELSGDYNIKFFSPYSQNGDGEAQGLLYRKSFTLSDWHYFWLSETPDVMAANDPTETATYNRGGCCGTLKHKATGIKFFVMVTHGAKNKEVRDKYAQLYIDMEKKYNPNGYPSFFVGDMNARPAQNSTATYLTYWKDVYLELDDTLKSGPFSTYNGFDTSLNLNTDPRRIDYIYYRNATPLNYVCNDATYGGYYASDHLPIYSDMLITDMQD